MSDSIGLPALLGTTDADDFLTDAWPNEPFIVHELSDSVKVLNELPFLKSLEDLLNAWPKLVQAHLPDVADESSAVEVTPANAIKLFRNKMALLFNNVEAISPVLKEWLFAIQKDLGLPSSTYARCMVYATPDGKGTAMHFDQNINFVLQLRGTKTWWLATNESVVNPTERYTVGQPMDPELASYVDGEMPSAMPNKAMKVVLNPGSMLFVPRGYWHSTEATGEALALNFTFSQPTWVDVFTLALRSRLLLSPEWRELADGVSSTDMEKRSWAAQRFQNLLSELVEDLPHWQAEDILNATEGEAFEEFEVTDEDAN